VTKSKQQYCKETDRIAPGRRRVDEEEQSNDEGRGEHESTNKREAVVNKKVVCVVDCGREVVEVVRKRKNAK